MYVVMRDHLSLHMTYYFFIFKNLPISSCKFNKTCVTNTRRVTSLTAIIFDPELRSVVYIYVHERQRLKWTLHCPILSNSYSKQEYVV